MPEVEEKRLPNILLADDQDSTLAAIAAFLEVHYKDRYKVIGAVTSGTALVNTAARTPPDVAVVDITMPGLSGLDAVAEIKKRNCDTKIVMLTVHWEPEFMHAAFAAGAIGYVLKHRLVTDLPPAIEAALRGETFVSPPLSVPAA
ncbi:MAG: response regulator transcription factor [Acidobacteria bacterium]|nr:response regulator transcription factor [Acidobacteriota bacterium]